MKEIEQIIQEIKSMPLLESAMNIYAERLIDLKTLIIKKDDYSPNEILIQNKIIRLKDENYILSNNLAIAYGLIEQYKLKFSFSLEKEFAETYEFIQKVIDDLQSQNSITYHIEKAIWKLLIYQYDKEFESDFSSCIKLFESFEEDKHPDGFFSFVEAYSDLLPEMNMDFRSLFNNTLDLLALNKKNASYINSYYGKILQGIRIKCFNEEEYGLELLKLALALPESEDVNMDMTASIISGLYDKVGLDFYEDELKHLLEQDKNLRSIFFGMSYIKKISRTESDFFIDWWDKYSSKDDLIVALLQLMYAIIKSENFDEKENYIPLCFSRISESLRNKAVVFINIQQLHYLQGYENERVDSILVIMQQDYFDVEKHLKSICRIFWYIHDVNLLKNALIKIAEKCPFIPVAHSSQINFGNFDKENLDELIVELFTDNKASNRFIAFDIFNHLSRENGYRFSVDILKLQPIDQYKLWVSLTINVREPRYILPALIPLIDSNSEIVKEAFVSKLEILGENYSGDLISSFKENIDEMNKEHHKILSRLESYVDDFFTKYVDVKFDLKELDPLYSQSKLYHEFNNLYFKNFGKQMEKTTDENSFMNFVSTVVLAKGGGWKTGDNRGISKLGKIQHRFTLSRNYFIDPTKFDLEEGQELMIDWKEDDFIQIKQLIDNE